MLSELRSVRFVTTLRLTISILSFIASIAAALILNEFIKSLDRVRLTFSWNWIYAVVGATLSIILLSILQELIQYTLTGRLKQAISDRIFSYYASGNLREFEKLSLETKFAYLSKQIDNIVFGINSFIDGVLIILRITLFSIALFILLPITLAYTLPLLFIMFVLPLSLHKIYRKIGKLYVQKTQQHNLLHQRILEHIDPFKDRGQREGVINYYKVNRSRNFEITKRFVRLSALIGFVTNFGSGVAHTLTISITILLIGMGYLDYYNLPAVIIFSFQIFTSTTEVLQISLIAYASTKRNYKEMFAANFNQPLPKLLDISDFETISLSDLSLSYQGRVVVRDLNLTIGKGDKILVIGESGSGKSTLVRVLLGLVDTSGSIYLDGRLLEGEEERASLFKLVSLATSNNSFLNASIRENLTFGQEDREREAKAMRLLASLNLANLELEREVGDSSNPLSLGERQRVGIIRSLLTDRPILIFDEATANLDKENNSRVIDELLSCQSTIIFISHTLSKGLAKRFQRVFKVKEGVVTPYQLS